MEMGLGQGRNFLRTELANAAESAKDAHSCASMDSPMSLQGPSDEFQLDKRWLIDPKLLYVGPRIGEGAHGKVYEGKYRDQIVAIKIIQAGDVPEEIARHEARFAKEVALLARVQHKNLVKFIGACKEPVMVAVTKLLVGGSLRKYMLSIRPKRLELRLAVSFALDIAQDMECLHAQFARFLSLDFVFETVISHCNFDRFSAGRSED